MISLRDILNIITSNSNVILESAYDNNRSRVFKCKELRDLLSRGNIPNEMVEVISSGKVKTRSVIEIAIYMRNVDRI